jgi:hypothetical protein
LDRYLLQGCSVWQQRPWPEAKQQNFLVPIYPNKASLWTVQCFCMTIILPITGIRAAHMKNSDLRKVNKK